MPWMAAKVEVYCNSVNAMTHLEGTYTTFLLEISNRLQLVLVCCMTVLQSWERCPCSTVIPEQAGLQLVGVTTSFTQTLMVVVLK